jgi:hypothetical protein
LDYKQIGRKLNVHIPDIGRGHIRWDFLSTHVEMVAEKPEWQQEVHGPGAFWEVLEGIVGKE